MAVKNKTRLDLKNINIYELVYDAILLCSVFFLEKTMYGVKDPNTSTLLYILLMYLIPWHMGIIYARYERRFGKLFLRFILGIFASVIFSIMIFIWIQTAKFEELKMIGEVNVMFFLCASAVMLIMSIIQGIVSSGAIKNLKPPEADGELGAPAILAAFTAGVLIMFYYFAVISTGGDNSFWKILLIFFGAPVGIAILIAVIILIKMSLIKLGIFKYLVRFKDLLIPVIVALLFVLLQKLTSSIFITAFGTVRPDPWKVFLLLTVTGFFPFRLILIFTPPVNPFNVIIGLLTMSVYINNLL